MSLLMAFLPTRREFLGLCSLSVLLASGLGCNSKPAVQHRKITLGPVAELRDGFTLFTLERVAILKEPAALAAVSAVCTHQTCILQMPAAGEEAITCPCHGSKFGRDGRVLTGPAEIDLAWYSLSVDAGIITVDLAQPVAAEWRYQL